MEKEELYPIGKVCKICDVSQRMLRYYEKIGLITPDRIAEPSHYRYYSAKNMLQIQIIRYLMDCGFTLDDINKIFIEDNMDHFQSMFKSKIAQTEDQIRYYHQRLDSLKNWCALLIEGQWVLKHNQQNITTKYIPRQRYFYCERTHPAGEPDSQAYLEIDYFTMSKRNGHSMVDMGGAFYAKYDRYTERIDNTFTLSTRLQVIYPNNKSTQNVIDFGGFMAVSAYHIGDPDAIRDSYKQIIAWAERHHFRLRGDCCERHVLDRYSTTDSANYVTEILLPVEEDPEDFALLKKWQSLD